MPLGTHDDVKVQQKGEGLYWNASQSGIAKTLANPNSTGAREFEYQYSDGSSSNVKLVDWGSLVYVWSEGGTIPAFLLVTFAGRCL